MSEIEVGEYIRTKGGYIGKVEHVTKGYKFRTTTGHIATGQERYLLDNRKSISKPYVTKHSKNILDLIEVGDYVNGSLINYIPDNEDVKKVYHDAQDMCDVESFSNEDIKTILTHEQYEENCYKVGE